MSWWLKRLLEFLKGFVPAFIKSWWDERQRLQAIADKGAADQREADRKSDDQPTQQAANRAKEISGLSDAELAARRERWLREPNG